MTHMQYVHVGIDMFNQLIELCKQENILDNIMPAFIIPLRDSSKLAPLDLIKFRLNARRMHELSPPSFHLFKRDLKKFYCVEEEYIKDIKLFPLLPIDKNCRTYYSCKRSAYAMANNWPEFGRCIYIEYYTNELLKP